MNQAEDDLQKAVARLRTAYIDAVKRTPEWAEFDPQTDAALLEMQAALVAWRENNRTR